jgi:hypothetical protein
MRSRQTKADAATVDLASMEERGPRCYWQGNDLMLLGRAIGGIHLEAKGARPWLMMLSELERAFARSDPNFDLGDRDVMLQMAVDAKAIGADDVADCLADCVRFPDLTPAEAQRIRPKLSFLAGRQPRVPYEIKSDWDESKHPREPAGSVGSIGGQFTSLPMADDPWHAETSLARFNRALDRYPLVSEKEKEAFRSTFMVEGHGKIDPDGGAVAGITLRTLDSMRAPDIVDPNKTRRELTYDDAVVIYHVYLDRELAAIGGIKRFEEIRDQRIATIFFDTLFAHGRTTGGALIQDAINDVLGGLSDADLKRLGLPANVGEDKIVGSVVFRALTVLVESGLGQQLRQRLKERRRKWAKGRKHEAGWLSRIESVG